jgi:hypothetical protein
MQPPQPPPVPLLVVVSLSLASMVLGPTSVAAECISIPETVAAELARHHVAFVGDVTAVNKALAPGVFGVYDVTFNVREAYKGAQLGPRTMRMLGTAEDFQFKVGQHVLLMGHRVTDVSEFPPEFRPQYMVQCTPTRLAAVDDPQLEELRRLARRRR